MDKKVILTLLVIVLIAILVLVFWQFSFFSSVNDFDSCVKAGNPVMESYPRQCNHNGETFIEEIDSSYNWKEDGIFLMQNINTKQYGCFGCTNVLCVDPGPDMTGVEETSFRYCGDEFNVIEN